MKIGNAINSIIGIDATYNVSKERYAVVVYTAVNIYYHTSVIALCLLSKEKAENYEFALTSYQEHFGSTPLGVYTDREKALIKALDEKWPQVKRRVCTFHLHRNVQQRIAKELGVQGNEFKKDLTKIIKERDQERFETIFDDFRKKYTEDKSENSDSEADSQSSEGENISKKKKKKKKNNTHQQNLQEIRNYLDDLYEDKEHWAFCYTHTTFTAGSHSTQRNESANHQIKRHIRASTRTVFIKLIDIFKGLNTNEQNKIETYKLKMNKIQNFQKNDVFETKLGETFAPIITKKIYLEYGLSSNYPAPELEFENSSIYKITLGGQTHAVNKIEDFCDCLRIRYLGLPCRHLFRLWTFLGVDLFKKTLSSCNKRWIIKFPSNYDNNLQSQQSTSMPVNRDLASSQNSTRESEFNQQIDPRTPKKEEARIHITGGSTDLSQLKLAENIKIKNVSSTNSRKKENLNENNLKRKADLISKSPDSNDLPDTTTNQVEQPTLKKSKNTTDSIIDKGSTNKKSTDEENKIKVLNIKKENEVNIVEVSSSHENAKEVNKVEALTTKKNKLESNKTRVPINKKKENKVKKVAAPSNKKNSNKGNQVQVSTSQDPKLFSLIKLNDNSCRFDTFLILMTFLYNSDEDFAEILPQDRTYDLLLDAIDLVNQGEHTAAQATFRSGLEGIKYGNSYLGAQGLQEIQPLFKYFLKGPRFEFIFKETKKCFNPNCPYSAINIPTFIQPPFILDTMPSQSISKSFIAKFLDTALTEIQDSHGCRCNPTHSMKQKSILTHIPDFLFLEVNLLNYDVQTTTISNSSNQSVTNTKNTGNKNSKQQKVVQFCIKEDQEKLKMKIDLMYEKKINGILYKFTLQNVILMENHDHFTLLFRNPNYKDTIYPNWIYYSDTKEEVQSWTDSDLDLSKLHEKNTVPLILGYKKTAVLD